MPTLSQRWNNLSFTGKAVIGITALAAVAAGTILSLGAAGVIEGGATGAFETVGQAIVDNYIPVAAGAGGAVAGLTVGGLTAYRYAKQGRGGRGINEREREISKVQEKGVALAPVLEAGKAPKLNTREVNFAQRASDERLRAQAQQASVA